MLLLSNRLQRSHDRAPDLAKTVEAVSQALAQLSTLREKRVLSRRHALIVPTARKLHGAAAILALSVLVDSAVEHYRGSFRNRAMYAPLGASSLTLLASLLGVF